MARGGLSSDPETRERQLAILADGRRIARERREAGLPTKRTEARLSSANTGNARQSSADAGGGGQSPGTGSRGSGKVVRGTYAKGDAARGRAATRTKKDPGDQGGPQLSGPLRAYARLLGFDVDD